MLLEGDDGEELGGALEDAGDAAAAEGLEDHVDEEKIDEEEGLEWLLEEQQAQQAAAASDLQHGAAAAAAAAAAALPELVPFDAFDPSLPGAGAVLEGGDNDLLLGGALEEDGSLEPTLQKPGDYDHDVSALQSEAAEWQALGQQLLSAGLQRAQQLHSQQHLAGLQQAWPSCEWQQQAWLRHLAAFEWLWGDLLLQQQQQQQQQQAGVQQHLTQLVQAAAVSLGMPAGGSSDGLEAGMAAWQEAAAAAAGGVREAVARLAAAGGVVVGDPSVCFKVLSGLVTRSRHWSSSAAGLLAGVSRLGEAALQLEFSRRGRLWAPGMPDGVDAFQGNASLLLQLRSTAAAVAAAEGEAAAAEALLASSQAAGQQAETAADEAAQEEAAAEQQLALKTPAALARAQALTNVLGHMVDSAESALALVKGGTGSTLHALQTLVERNSAARDLAPITSETLAQHGRCVAVLQRLRGIGAAAAAGLQEALLLNQQQQQQQQGVQQEQGGEQQQQQQRRLLELLLQHMSPALQGVKDELQELGQAHILLTQLTHQLDSLAAAAETVAAAITADHAMQMAAGSGKHGAAAAAAASGSSAAVRPSSYGFEAGCSNLVH
ncbi:hypothetical protein OEZ86_001399 [Tetradesmus obliquus]|nr:hypothetical protein OEZ86_001399 [Tetradesmus obliquus]